MTTLHTLKTIIQINFTTLKNDNNFAEFEIIIHTNELYKTQGRKETIIQNTRTKRDNNTKHKDKKRQ